MAKERTFKLDRNYNWWSLAGRVYGDQMDPVAAQRYFDVLKAANQGVSLTRGSVIRVPKIDPTKPHYLSHTTVAKERGEYDYGTGQITGDYWDAVNQYRSAANQGYAAGQTTTGVGTAGADLTAPEGFALPDVKAAEKYGPRQYDARAKATEYTPPIPDTYEGFQLPQEYYEYFYSGRADNRARQREHEARRDRLRQEDRLSQQRRQDYAASHMHGYTNPNAPPAQERRFGVGDVTRAPKTPAARAQALAEQMRRFREADAESVRKFDFNQKVDEAYGPLFRAGESIVDALGAGGRALRTTFGWEGRQYGESEEDFQKRIEREEQEKRQFGIGDVERAPPTPSAQAAGRLETLFPDQEQKPYTTDWLERWLDTHDPSEWDDATRYMLRVVGYDPDIQAGIGGGAYYGGGRTSSVYRRRGGGGGGTSGGGGYAYPSKKPRYATTTPLVSWRI